MIRWYNRKKSCALKKGFWTKEEETRVNIQPRISANRPSKICFPREFIVGLFVLSYVKIEGKSTLYRVGCPRRLGSKDVAIRRT